jgi:glyoxylase-like metal-dependent hydrolase (beta-lactamase superfamily II)/uncharacterized protein (DUF1015 family)
VIGATALDELLTADPHNVVRLILPARVEAGENMPGGALGGRAQDDSALGGSARDDSGGDANAHAAARMRAWLEAGILAADPQPSMYVYEQRASGASGPGLAREGQEPGSAARADPEQDPDGWVQRGLIALVKVGDPESAGILPHEDVMPGPVRDRRDLMAATRANLEPIFLVYGAHEGNAYESGGAPGPGSMPASWTTEVVDHVADTCPPLVTAVTGDGITHRLWRLEDPARHSAIAADLAGRPALIADGHHRYAAYQELQDLMRAGGHGGGPWDFGLAFIVDADAYPPRLGAIHRVIPGLRPADAARLAAGSFQVQALGGGTLARALACLAKAGHDGHAFLLAGKASDPAVLQYWLLTGPDRERLDAVMPAAASPAWRDLDAAISQRLLLDDAWGIQDNDRDVPVFHDAAEAVRAATGSGGTAVISNPVPFAAVTEIARHGERVPRKSTSFGPKPRSGLVLRSFDALSPVHAELRARRGRARCPAVGEGVIDRVIDAEHLAQPGDLEDPQDAALGDHQVDGAIVGAHSLEAAHQHAEAGGVEELDSRHVDNEPVGPRVDQAKQRLAELRRRVDIDLAAHLDDRPAWPGGVLIEREVHGLSPLSTSVWDNSPVPDNTATTAGKSAGDSASPGDSTDAPLSAPPETSVAPEITDLGNDVFQIDTRMAGYAGITAGYLIRGSRPCLVETGTAPSAPLVRDALASLGVGTTDLATVVVTHIHLDHAGGAGDVAAMYPKAEVVVHQKGARHLADPSRLMASARQVYGDALDFLFGELAPVPHDRIRALDDTGSVDLGGGRRLDSHYSPGHARHHVGLIDSLSGDLYVGDAAGVYIPDTGDLRPATPPPDFDLAIALESLRKFAALQPTRLLFSHYGPAGNVPEILDRSAEEITVWVEQTRAARFMGLDLDHAVAMVRDRTRSRYASLADGADPEVAAKFERISGAAANVGGIWHWLEKAEQ